MRVRTPRNALVMSSAAVIMLTAAGCHQATAENSSAPADYDIVGISQIDGNGKAVPSAAGAAPADPAGDGKATCAPVSIAAVTPTTGADSALGANVKDGAQLAVDEHNAANPGCQVTLKVFDTEDDPQKATEVVPQIVDDASIIGVVGPTFSGETKSTGSIFDQAGLVATTPAATNVTLVPEQLEDVLPRLGQ